MDLIFGELKNELFQTIKPNVDVNLAHIRPKIIKFGSPTGDLKIQIQDSDGFLIEESSVVDITTISVLNFAHGYLKFNTGVSLKKDLIYRINLVAFGTYVFNDDNFVGFCRDFDLRKVDADFVPSTGFKSAYDIELWERRMSDRVVEFFDGFTSNTQPQAGELSATSLNTFVDDAAFVTFKGSAAADGDLYKNSATDLIRYHDGVAFKNISFQTIGETQADINNLEAGPTDIAGLIFASASIRSAHIQYTILRRTDSAEKRETGILKAQFKPDGATWEIARESDFDNDVGVTITITAAGQFQYSSDNLAGANYNGFIRFKTIKTFTPEV